MQEYGAAAAGNAGARVVVDLDNEIVEVVLAPQAVARLAAFEPNRLVVMAVGRVFAPGILAADRAHRQKAFRADMAVGTPPQLPGMEGAAGGAAVALALVGPDAAPAERDRDGQISCRQPATAGVAGRGANADDRQRTITHRCLISD